MAKKKTIDLRSLEPTPVPAGDVNIIYNGTRIAGFSEDTDATLKTGGTRVLHDIDVNYTAPSAPYFIATFTGTTAGSDAACDKTFAEITAAIEAGMQIVLRYNNVTSSHGETITTSYYLNTVIATTGSVISEIQATSVFPSLGVDLSVNTKTWYYCRINSTDVIAYKIEESR